MDVESVYTLNIGLGSQWGDEPSDTPSKLQTSLIDFILEFRVDNQFIYRCGFEACAA
jgi:hypothetical protein